jgi:hypothetical protein
MRACEHEFSYYQDMVQRLPSKKEKNYVAIYTEGKLIQLCEI